MHKFTIAIAVVIIIAGGAWYFIDYTTVVDYPASKEQHPSNGVPNTLAPGMNNATPPSGISTTSPEVQAPDKKEFTVESKGFSFVPSTITVKKGDTVKITFKNTGGTHNWGIDEFNARTPQIASGESATMEFVANKSGSFEYYCSVGPHRAIGMKGTLIVQ